jgi:cytochrome P450
LEDDTMSTDDIKQMADKFDHTAPEQMQQPHAMYAQFRDKCPIGRSGQHGGFYFVSRYDAVKKLFEDFQTFSSAEGVGIPPHPYKMYPIDLDPPAHTKYRRILNRRFTPEAVAPKREQVEAVVGRLIDAFIGKGSADFAADLVRPLLPAIVLPLLGVPVEDQPRLSGWIEYMTRGRATDLPGVMKAGEEIGKYLMALAARRRNEPRGDDVISLLLETPVDGSPLTDEDIYRVLLIILFGGLDTTSAVMLESLLYIARNPEVRTALSAEGADWGSAIEEFVRYTSPIQGLRRTVTKDTEVEGQPLKAGDWVFGLHGSANRDASVFADADRCVLDRTPNPHLGFGAGGHICLGRNLARLEIEVLLKAVLRRMPDYRVAEDFVPEYLVGEARGMTRLPVAFTPGPRL